MSKDFQEVIAKLQAAVDEIDSNGGEGTIDFMNYCEGKATLIKLNRDQAVQLIADMEKDMGETL